MLKMTASISHFVPQLLQRYMPIPVAISRHRVFAVNHPQVGVALATSVPGMAAAEKAEVRPVNLAVAVGIYLVEPVLERVVFRGDPPELPDLCGVVLRKRRRFGG